MGVCRLRYVERIKGGLMPQPISTSGRVPQDGRHPAGYQDRVVDLRV